MARLTTRSRDSLPPSDFALPGKIHTGPRGAKITKGAYPDENRAHARDALSRVSADGTPSEKREVRERVEKKYPGMVRKGDPDHGEARRGMVPRGEHHEANHREPRTHEEFERLGNGKR